MKDKILGINCVQTPPPPSPSPPTPLPPTTPSPSSLSHSVCSHFGSEGYTITQQDHRDRSKSQSPVRFDRGPVRSNQGDRIKAVFSSLIGRDLTMLCSDWSDLDNRAVLFWQLSYAIKKLKAFKAPIEL